MSLKLVTSAIFFYSFGKTVSLIFNGLTDVNVQAQKMTKKGRFLCPYKLIVCSLRVVDRYQNLYGTSTIQMRATICHCYRSIASVVFELFCIFYLIQTNDNNGIYLIIMNK